MTFVGFVPWAAVPSYVASGTPAAAAVGATGAAAAAAAAAAPALLLGAGLLGWEIGTQLRNNFAPEVPEGFPPPQAPFTGGQQAGRLYTVRYTGIGTDPPSIIELPAVVRVGPVRGVGMAQVGSQVAYRLLSGSEPLGLGQASPEVWQDIGYPSIISVTPVDGMPDLQRNPPYQYLPAPLADPAILTPTIPFPFLPGSPEFPSEIVPFQRPSTPTTTPSTEPDQEEEPKIAVKVPDLGIQVDFNPDGVKIRGYNPEVAPRTAPQNDPRYPNAPKLITTVCDCPPCDLDPVLEKLEDMDDKLDEIEECACEGEYVFQFQGLGSGNSLVATLPPDTISVTINISEAPSNARRQSGGAALEVYYAGWCAFSDGTGSAGERLPVHYLATTFYPPPFAQAFSYTLYDGFNATLVAKRRVPEEEG